MKIKVGVFFGGNSVEHEISVITMNQAISSLNPENTPTFIFIFILHYK